MIIILDKYERLDEFEEILNEIYEEIPPEFLEDLNLGIVIEEESKIHPESLDDDLYILGSYIKGPMGRGIVIYYGSFMDLYWYADRNWLKDKLRDTLFHEITHHRENLARIPNLEVEDEKYIESYKEAKNKN